MKNILVALLIIICSVWLLWIRLNSSSPAEPKKPTVATVNRSIASPPRTEREQYQALSEVIRVFESDLALEKLTPITTVLNTELPRLRTEDRYRIYMQLEQAINAYINRLNRDQSALIERYAELQSQLWQQVDTAEPTPSVMAQMMNLVTPSTPDPVAEQTAQLDSDRQAEQRFEQQWPHVIKQGLTTKQQQTLAALAKQQIDVLYLGEGMYEFRLNPRYWVTHVAPHLAKADQVYFALVAEQEQQQYAYDAALVISWQALGERVQVWEQYLKNHPKSYFVDDAQRKHDEYLEFLLLGMDNTPTYEQGVLLPEVQAAYLQLIQQYPNSRFSKTLQLFQQQFPANPSEDLAVSPSEGLSDQPIDVAAAARRATALAKDQINN